MKNYLNESVFNKNICIDFINKSYNFFETTIRYNKSNDINNQIYTLEYINHYYHAKNPYPTLNYIYDDKKFQFTTLNDINHGHYKIDIYNENVSTDINNVIGIHECEINISDIVQNDTYYNILYFILDDLLRMFHIIIMYLLHRT